MTPEEEFNQEVWHVLQRIRKAELATVGKNIEYKFPHFVGVGIIPKEKQKKILYKLQEWKALKIRENPWEPPVSTPDTFHLNLLQPKFNETYEKFEKACDVTSYLNDFQDKALRNTEEPKFSQVDQMSEKINKWLDTKEQWTLKKIWQVMSALNYEWQLQDEKAFNIPHHKFERARITALKDLEAILKSLHKKKVIRVSRKIAETPPTNDPNKPQGSIWATVIDEPNIVYRADTVIEIFPNEFVCLRDSLEKRVKNKENSRTESRKENADKNKKKQKKKINFKNLSFSEEEPAIKNDGLSCQLPPYKNEFYLCKIMFGQKTGAPVDWDIVYKEMTGDDNFENKWRVVYDTMRRVNGRFKKTFKTKSQLFYWQNKTIKRNF